MTQPSRRDFIRYAAAAGAAAFSFSPRAAHSQSDDLYGGFTMGMQGWCLRKFALDPTLQIFRDLGIRHCGAAPMHLGTTDDPERIQMYKKKLEAAGVSVWTVWGGFSREIEKNRPHFVFAKAMGARSMIGDPGLGGWDGLEKLAEEFDLKVAFHNHAHKIADIAKAIDKRSHRLGVCVDTGNFIRSGVDPLEAIRTFGDRVYEVHLKDAEGPGGRDVVLGRGKLDVAGTFRALRALKFQGCLSLEYEEKPENPVPDLKACLEVVQNTVKTL